MNKSDFYYNLPQELIAQTPVYPRDSSRLLVFKRQDKQIEHKIFSDIIDYLHEGDLLIVNNTKVIPARLYGKKENTGGKIEFLLLKRRDNDEWEVILKPGRKAKIGAKFIFSDELSAEVIGYCDDGGRIVKFFYDGIFEEILDRIGLVPLPPYITEKLEDKQRYQTVYSKINGSSAAPTAGLHFTNELLEKIKAKGVEIKNVLLHVGLGTFRPVAEDDVLKHHMHSEYYEISEDTANSINKAKKEGRRVIAVGTTSVRVLESVANDDGTVNVKKGETQIFIYPPYKFKVVDALITNFHLPESTLIMLVSAFSTHEDVMNLYNVAVEERYRFFSFGDAMFIY